MDKIVVAEPSSALDIDIKSCKRCNTACASRELSREISARRELQSHKLSASLWGTSVSSAFAATFSDTHSPEESSPRLTTTERTIEAEEPQDTPKKPSAASEDLDLSPLSTPAGILEPGSNNELQCTNSATHSKQRTLWSPDRLGLGPQPSSLSELSLTSAGFLHEDARLAQQLSPEAADKVHEDLASQAATASPNPPNHKYTFQVVQVSWSSVDGSDAASLCSTPRRTSTSLCSHPVTLLTQDQDEEHSSLAADNVLSCACTLSSVSGIGGPTFSYTPLDGIHPPTKVPTLRLLPHEGAASHCTISDGQSCNTQEASCSGWGTLQRCRTRDHCSSDGAHVTAHARSSTSPRLCAQLLKRMAQSPRTDIAALCAAAADGDSERAARLLQRGVPHTPPLAPAHSTSPAHVFTAADIDAAATPLMLAASAATPGHVECVRRLLAAGAVADWALPEGRTALFDAVKSGCLLTVQLLLSEGADPGRGCAWGFTPLLLACQAFGADNASSLQPTSCAEEVGSSAKRLVDYPGIVRALLDAGADAVAACPDGQTAIEFAASRCGDTSVVRMLLEVLGRTDARGSVERALAVAIQHHNHAAVELIATFPGVDLNGGSGCGPALVATAATGDARVLLSLLAAGADVRCTGHRQRTALHACAACDQEGEALGVLLAAGAELDALDDERCTPLMHAADAGNATAAVELLQEGARVDSRNRQGLSALHIACRGSQTNVASALLAAGASVDLRSTDGLLRTPLFDAAAAGCASTLSLLLAAGAAVACQDAQGSTPLLHACQNADSESGACVVEELLRAGADACSCDRRGCTPVFAACRVGFSRGVRALLVHRGAAVVHSRLPDGTTPLIAAAEAGKAKVVALLLQAGASPEHQRRCDGVNAVMAAAAGGHDACVRALVASGVHVTDRACMCMTALHFAALAGNCNIVKRLVRAGAVVDARNARGATPLMLAAETGFCAAVSELLRSGADPSLTDFHGSTPAAIAGRKGNRSALRKLRRCLGLRRGPQLGGVSSNSDSACACAAATRADACMAKSSSDTLAMESAQECEGGQRQQQHAASPTGRDASETAEYSFGNLFH